MIITQHSIFFYARRLKLLPEDYITENNQKIWTPNQHASSIPRYLSRETAFVDMFKTIHTPPLNSGAIVLIATCQSYRLIGQSFGSRDA